MVGFRFEIIHPKPVLSAMYGRNFKPKIFKDITMPAKLFVAQILVRYPKIYPPV